MLSFLKKFQPQYAYSRYANKKCVDEVTALAVRKKCCNADFFLFLQFSLFELNMNISVQAKHI